MWGESLSVSLVRGTLRGLPVIVLLSTAGHHFLWSHWGHLSPWLGGGFGMFASTDITPVRRVYLYAVDAAGRRRPVDLPRHLDELALRVEGFPHRHWLEELAKATHRHLADDPKAPAALAVEVWRNVYDADLRPRAQRVAALEMAFPRREPLAAAAP